LASPYLLEQKDTTLALTVYIQPRASRNRLAGLHGKALKLCITAPPVDNQANKGAADFIARLLKISRQSVILKSGHQSRTKRFTIKNISLAEADRLLNLALNK
jgi:uncharacterized protein (TIGR00251 family)